VLRNPALAIRRSLLPGW